jgi:hypothetical protein
MHGMSQLIGSLGQLFVDVMSQLRIKCGRPLQKIRPTPDISTVHFLFDRLDYFTPLEAKSSCATKEILFDGYLMKSEKTVQKYTFFGFFPANEKARNLGRSQAFDSPPSGYAAVQWFAKSVADISGLPKTFFLPFLFDGKSSEADIKPGKKRILLPDYFG